jgi:uncharacterized protein with NAD-binding domain and iron-sulfur cluster
MGDVVFAPFYEVLKQRGVLFQFFHRLENVKLAEPTELADGERPYVKELEFAIQAEVRDGEYRPLIDVAGLPCWPSTPDYLQLVEGERLKQRRFESHWDREQIGGRTLRVAEDFDFVVLGIGLGAIPFVCRDFLERDQRWRDMVTHLKTIETQAFQLWMRGSSGMGRSAGLSVRSCSAIRYLGRHAASHSRGEMAIGATIDRVLL